ncbi:hypothetical protein FQA39_LY18158 [Lamprigera yunnana]|nr:hypothetical protein FQA39_LY18158 [Lamprigera yunnana]
MNSARKILPLARLSVRQFTRSAVKCEEVKEVPSPGFKKVKELQKKFQEDNGIPVYLKGGRFDRVLYQATLVLLAITLGMSAEVIYTMATK